jgi:PmbA protein
MEEAARSVAVSPTAKGAGVSAGRSVTALATSHGFCRGYTTSGYSCSASVIAGSGGDMQRDYESHSVRHLDDLDDPTRSDAWRPSARWLGSIPASFRAARCRSCSTRASEQPGRHLLSAITGSAITRKTSFLLGARGEEVFPDAITIRDNPHKPRGLRSKPSTARDGDQAQRSRRDGRLTGWLLDSASAVSSGSSRPAIRRAASAVRRAQAPPMSTFCREAFRSRSLSATSRTASM